jgi:NAD(P)-dependent dehydrogenase (short-subunit alcohol dehydrogenase family)
MIAAMAALAGKVALVLGGCGEVGEGITRALLAAGAVVAVSSRDNNRLSELHDRLPVEWDGRYVPIHGDIGSPTGVLAVRDRVQFVCHNLDIVVASLGGWWRKGPLIFSTIDDWTRVLANNLTPHYLAATALVPAINKRPGSAYVFISGAAADVPVPNSGLMSVSAHAEMMLMRVLASEHRHEPIRINALVLGTPIVSRSRPDGDADWLTSEEVGQYVAWLVSDRSAMRGQIIRFNSRSQLTDLRWQ